MRNKLFSLTLVFIFAIGLAILFGPQRDINVLERREAFKTSQIKIDNLAKDIDTVISDQFPKRDTVLSTYYKVKVDYYSALGKSSSSQDFTLEKVDDVMILDGEYCMDDRYSSDASECESTVRGKAYNIKMVDEKYPDIKTYIYHPTRIEETSLLDNAVYKSKIQNYKWAFLSEIGENIKYKELELNSIDDYKEYYYKTDHHWNIKGAYKGYCEIIEMLQEDLDIDDPREIQDEITIDQEFTGHFGNLLGRVTNSDKISDYDLGISPYTYMYTIDGMVFTVQHFKDEFIENGENDIQSGYDIYFGGNEFERIFDFDQEDKPNLLIFSDSFVNPIKEWLASHFNVTVILDMRAKPEDFNLDYYIEEYDIDAILMLQYYGSVYYNGYLYIPIE